MTGVQVVMARSRVLRLTLAAFATWCISLTLIRFAYPVYFDGGGPMPSFFYIGDSPSLAEYSDNRLKYELHFLIPQCIAAAWLAFVCVFVTPKLGNQVVRSRGFVGYSFISAALILATTGISDVLNVFWLKRGVFWTLYPLLLMKLVIVTLLVAFSSALLLILVERPCTNPPKP